MSTTETILAQINQKLGQQPLFFIAPETERGMGLEKLLENYFVIAANADATSTWLEGLLKGKLIKESGGSTKLLANQEFQAFVQSKFTKDAFRLNNSSRKINLQFFKSTSDESVPILTQAGIIPTVLNNSAELTRQLENKVKQYQILLNSPVVDHLPESQIIALQDFDETKFKSVFKSSGLALQLPFGHTGSSTYLIDDTEKGRQNLTELQAIRQSFPKRVARIVRKIEGLPLTINACNYGESTFSGGLSYQYTGIAQLTALSSATVGNDWSLPKEFITEQLRGEIADLAQLIGQVLHKQFNFRGLFGLDLIWEVETNKLYLIEINPRQTASIPMHTKLQLEAGQIPLSVLHLAEFLRLDLQELKINSQDYSLEALQPFAASQVFLRSQSRQSFAVPASKLNPGVYRQQSDSAAREAIAAGRGDDVIYLDADEDRPIIRQGEGYSLDDFSTDGFLLLIKPTGTTIEFNEEMARLKIRQSLGMYTAGRVQLLPLAQDALQKIGSVLS